MEGFPSSRARVGPAAGGSRDGAPTDGRLFYLLDSETMVSVEVTTEGEFTHGDAKKLFTVRGMRGNFPDESPWLHRYDVTDDGQRFVFVRRVEGATPR